MASRFLLLSFSDVGVELGFNTSQSLRHAAATFLTDPVKLFDSERDAVASAPNSDAKYNLGHGRVPVDNLFHQHESPVIVHWRNANDTHAVPGPSDVLNPVDSEA